MRRSLLLAACAFMAAAIALPEIALAQASPRRDEQRQQQEAAKKKKSKEEWNNVQAPLQALRNEGPCPFVKVLYDAGRYIEFKDAKEASANVAYTGEIQGISAGCQYKDDEPIQVQLEVLL